MQRSRTVTVERGGETKVYNQTAIQHNAEVVEYTRTCTAVFSGLCAGILGLISLYGFGFYLLAAFGMWLIFVAKAGPDYQRYFTSRKALLTNGFFGAVFTYILCWTFGYGVVHVY